MTAISFRASAPVRLDFAGGWTDVAPFATREGGAVVNAAIERRVHVELTMGGEHYRLHSEGFGAAEESLVMWPAEKRGPTDLRKAALRHSGLPCCTLRTRSDVPAGSGLGGSGALGVAVLAAIHDAHATSRAPAELATEAFLLESVDAALSGGKQDQWAAAHGGFNHWSFVEDQVTGGKLLLDPAFMTALEQQIVICYTGVSRVSSNTIARVMDAYSLGKPPVVDALHALRDIAHEMADAMRSADLGRVAALLTRNWECQQALDPVMQTPAMAELERVMQGAGALGWKAAGAGAGGSIFFLVRDRVAAEAAARSAGAQVLPFTWATSGVLTERS